jgi:hypothetical protein
LYPTAIDRLAILATSFASASSESIRIGQSLILSRLSRILSSIIPSMSLWKSG